MDYAQISLSINPGIYAGGTAAGFPTGGGSVTYQSAGLDGVFDVGLIPLGVPYLVNAPTATPNPAYALSPVKLTGTAATPGTYTYQWFAEDDLNGIPSTPIPGATGTNATVIPADLFPGNGNNYAYPTNFYFVATRTTDGISVTSSVMTLNVFSATAPGLTDTYSSQPGHLCRSQCHLYCG